MKRCLIHEQPQQYNTQSDDCLSINTHKKSIEKAFEELITYASVTMATLVNFTSLCKTKEEEANRYDQSTLMSSSRIVTRLLLQIIGDAYISKILQTKNCNS
ncbi:hypothetical protein Bca4012_090760 [Brassica carinata]|uniref:(rape) hypothetical protein n=1 Tax=Brassica napus TaxID=3708 RepID=A0A816RWI5_BRANA|nr:unnamed protein product [Brassica napus]